MDNSLIWNGQNFFSIAKETQELLKKNDFFQNSQMTPKMFLDIVEVITTSKLNIFKTFQGGGSWSHPSCQIGLTLKENKLRSDSLLDDFQTISYQMFYKIDSSRLWILLYVKNPLDDSTLVSIEENCKLS